MIRRGAAIVAVAGLLFTASDARAQHEEHSAAPPNDSWAWTGAAQIFLTANLQDRRFTDFNQVESQNWLMANGARRAFGRWSTGVPARQITPRR